MDNTKELARNTKLSINLEINGEGEPKKFEVAAIGTAVALMAALAHINEVVFAQVVTQMKGAPHYEEFVDSSARVILEAISEAENKALYGGK